MNWLRDWVYRVISPFLAQLKNRLANIKVVTDATTGKQKFYSGENIPIDLIGMKEPEIAGDYLRKKDAEGITSWQGITLLDGASAIVLNEHVWATTHGQHNDNNTWHVSFFSSEFTLNAGEEYNMTARVGLFAYQDSSLAALAIYKDGVEVAEIDSITVQDRNEAEQAGWNTQHIEGTWICQEDGAYKLGIKTNNWEKESNKNKWWFALESGRGPAERFRVTRLNGMKGAVHSHLNISTLNKLGEDVDGHPTYDGKRCGLNKKEINDIAIRATVSGGLTLNPNPYFTNDDVDYTTYLNNYPATVSIVKNNVPNALAALKITGSVHTLIGDTFCPMPKSLEYKASIDVKATKNGLAEDGSEIMFYLGVISYDSDESVIYAQHVNYVNINGDFVAGVDPMVMELTRDLVDENVYFTFKTGDISKIFHVEKSYGHCSKFHKKQANGEYCYVGINGRIYDNLGMSKDLVYSGWAVLDEDKNETDVEKWIQATGQQVDGKDEYHLKLIHTLTPRNANISYTAGDVWVQSAGGSTYSYWISSQRFPLDGKWHHYECDWKRPTNYDGKNDYGFYRNGTAYVRLMMLPQYYYNDGSGDRYVTDADNIACYYGNIALLKRNI